MILFESGTFATLFEPDPYYPMTIKIVENFIKSSMANLSHHLEIRED